MPKLHYIILRPPGCPSAADYCYHRRSCCSAILTLAIFPICFLHGFSLLLPSKHPLFPPSSCVQSPIPFGLNQMKQKKEDLLSIPRNDDELYKTLLLLFCCRYVFSSIVLHAYSFCFKAQISTMYNIFPMKKIVQSSISYHK